ncbi:MAG: 6-hydroxymethylpterin diphosphokinase MptE-like protein [Candidatus Thorarchaeota archaeon]
MRWSEWEPTYRAIARRLSLDVSLDFKATEMLTQILADQRPRREFEHLKHIMTDRDVVICGAGPSLDDHIETLRAKSDLENYTIVAADGAYRGLLSHGVRCDLIVTDLDGIDILHPPESLVIVHAHGDNMPLLERFVSQLGFVLGSTQVKPTPRVHLWGGFTDGDRACHIVAHYRPRRIILAGMDFGVTVGRWSKPEFDRPHPASRRKQIKLEIAKQLVQRVLSTSNVAFTFL